MPKASVTPSSLTTPFENLEAKPETEMRTEPSTGIRLFFSMYAQCLAQTNQMSFLKVTQIEAENTRKSKAQVNSICKTHEEGRERPEGTFQEDIQDSRTQRQAASSIIQENT
ncbi:hypothetical protein G9A89_014863 [Geosiphon pyriformis]|nr:hypothetical protein G9A89_014863 [Geosiphon pyriformis]